ncbi:MAG: hypothetical protein LBF95_08895, partial [Treponema sp.]|nr:hypothetical protein [Treponema sp.]
MRDHDKTVPHDWHAAFRDAIRLTFFPYLHVLSFEFEHPLNTEPLRIDAVIIKKEPGIIIDNPLGSMFRRINIVEYKSPNDYLSVYDYHKVCAYARLYFAVHHLAEGIEEMTVTLVGRRRPRKLLGHLRETCGYEVNERGSGIYEVKGEPYRVQVVVTEELEGEVEWLRELRGGL